MLAKSEPSGSPVLEGGRACRSEPSEACRKQGPRQSPPAHDRALRVDYDRIAANYDRRFTGSSPTQRSQALFALVRELGARRILEVGCGTGHWLATMHAPGRDLWGLDPSSGMLARARRRDAPLHLVQGYARRLPFPPESFDLVYCVNALHHFHDPRAFIGQAYRLLRPGGALAIIGTDPHGRRESWYVYRFFDGTYETDLTRFPTWETVWDWLAAAGFARLSLAEVEHIEAPKQGRQVLADPFLQKNACSQLALLSDEAYRAGLDRIEAALAQAEAGGETLVFQTDIVIEMLTGRRPSRPAGGI